MFRSKNIYSLPFPPDTKIENIVKNSPGHTGQYATAIDFAIALNTPVLAPLDGRVITVVDSHSKYGPSIEFANYANYIQIEHDNGEISDLMHLDKGSVAVKVGERIVTGQEIARTGLSGWMTAPHLHWFVFRPTTNKAGFVGLDIGLNT